MITAGPPDTRPQPPRDRRGLTVVTLVSFAIGMAGQVGIVLFLKLTDRDSGQIPMSFVMGVLGAAAGLVCAVGGRIQGVVASFAGLLVGGLLSGMAQLEPGILGIFAIEVGVPFTFGFVAMGVPVWKALADSRS